MIERLLTLGVHIFPSIIASSLEKNCVAIGYTGMVNAKGTPPVLIDIHPSLETNHGYP